MREFRSLSLRTFDEISLENSRVVSRCFRRNFAKTKRENSPHFRAQRENSLRQREKIRRIFETSAKIRHIFETSAKNQKRLLYAKFRGVVCKDRSHIDRLFSFVNNCSHFDSTLMISTCILEIVQ